MRVVKAPQGFYDAQMEAYEGMTDEQLMDLAKRILAVVTTALFGWVERARMWAGHESVMNELNRRMVRHLNQQLGLPDIDL